jgi:hypothetical protein
MLSSVPTKRAATKFLCYATGSALLLALLLYGLLVYLFTDHVVRHQVLDLTATRRIEIWNGTLADPCFGIYFRVLDGPKQTVPRTRFDKEYGFDIPDYMLVAGRAAKIVGVARCAEPEVLFAIHDLTTGETWWSDCLDEQPELGNRMLAKLKGAMRTAELVLDGTEGEAAWRRNREEQTERGNASAAQETTDVDAWWE